MENKYESVKELLFCKAVPLDDAVDKGALFYIPAGDIAITANLFCEKRNDTVVSIPVNQYIIHNLGVTRERIFTDALENTRKMRETSFFGSLNEYFAKKIGTPLKKGGDDLYLLLDEPNIAGAAIYFASPEIQEHISEVLGDGYFIIPSSRHELLFMRSSTDPCALKDTIRSINRSSVVDENNFLSDGLYRYLSGSIQMVEV